MPSLERRVSRRYPINLPVLLEKGQGETRDISLQGVYILSSQSYGTGIAGVAFDGVQFLPVTVLDAND